MARTTMILPARPVHVPAIERLLRDNSLPLDGVGDRLGSTLVGVAEGTVVGTAALELFPDGALLRSVAVAADHRGSGVGERLVSELLEMARERQVGDVYLLTTTAGAYFPRFGFERITREAVPPGVRASREFTTACPASATVMRKAMDISTRGAS